MALSEEPSAFTSKNSDSLISEGEAISLLAHEMSNSLMVIQSRLDTLRGRYGQEPGFQEIQKTCNKSSTVLRGAMALLRGESRPKQLFALGAYMEQILADLVPYANHSLALRTHEECSIFASARTLRATLSQILANFLASDENPELYIEVYPSEFEGGSFGVISLMGNGRPSDRKSIWSMLEALMQLQGGELVVDTYEGKQRICLLLPLFQKRDTLYALRNQTEISSALVVDDNQDVADAVSMTLGALGIPQVEVFTHPQEALEWLSHHTPALVIIDYAMMGMNGIEFLRQARGALASSTVAIMSGMPLSDYQAELEQLDIPVKILMKPLKGDDLLRLVMQSLSGAPVETLVSSDIDLQSLRQTIRLPAQPQRPNMPS